MDVTPLRFRSGNKWGQLKYIYQVNVYCYDDVSARPKVAHLPLQYSLPFYKPRSGAFV